MLAFTRYFFKLRYNRRFVIGDHHKIICDALDRVMSGQCLRLIINIAPRYGKTELAVINLIACWLGRNAAAKFIHLSYSDDLALDNSERIRELVQEDYYRELFPNVVVKKDSKAKKKWYTTAGGGVYATAAAGQVTGFGAGQVDDPDKVKEESEAMEEFLNNDAGGAIIIDDPIKPEDADSDTLRLKVNERFDSTIRNRVNSRNTPIIVIMQRLHPEDLCGYLQREDEQDKWEIISLPCLIDAGNNTYRALWPFKETVEELLKQKKANEVVFGRQKQQDPSPKFGLLFPKDELEFYDNYNEVADNSDTGYLAADPANLGGDSFAAGDTKMVGSKIYLHDVLFNKEGTNINEDRVVNMIKESNVKHVGIEGVLTWIEVVKRIRKRLEIDNVDCEVRALKPRVKKHTRIYNRASFIKNNFVFRADYANFPEYAAFMKELMSYQKVQTAGESAKHDDAPDVLEMIANYYERTFPNLFI